MAPTSQKPNVRPVSFVFHDMTVAGSAPREVQLALRPEDLSIATPSRLSVHQTLGGAWVDNFGAGLPVINISGHTGWRGTQEGDGLALMQRLHQTVFSSWHSARAAALQKGLDPDLVRLIFADALDNVTWVVAPNQFVLKRNKSRPLLAQYQISMTYVSSDVKDTMAALAAKRALTGEVSAETLLGAINASLQGFVTFIGKLKGDIAKALGPIRAAVKDFVNLTANALRAVKSVVGPGGLISSVSGTLISIARDLTMAGANIAATVAGIANIGSTVRAAFMAVGAAFHNAFCVLSNAFKVRKRVQNYSDLYGASTCSSTAGGRPQSKYMGSNPFYDVLPMSDSTASVSHQGAQALSVLKSIDPVINPPLLAALESPIKTAVASVTLKGQGA